MTKEVIAVGDDVLEIDAAPLTLIFKSPNLTKDVTYAGRLPLNMEACLYHMERTQTIHADTPKYVRMAFPFYLDEITPDSIRREGMGFQHVAGRIDMTLKYMQMGVPIAWVHPEDGLHPKVQLALADVAIILAQGS